MGAVKTPRRIAAVLFALVTAAGGGVSDSGEKTAAREIPIVAESGGASSWVRISGGDRKTATLFVAPAAGPAAVFSNAPRAAGTESAAAAYIPGAAAVAEETARVVSAAARGEITARNAKRTARLFAERIRRAAAPGEKKDGPRTETYAEKADGPAEPTPLLLFLPPGEGSPFKAAREPGGLLTADPFPQPETTWPCDPSPMEPPLARPGG